jgi:hypothetical protein
MSIRKYGGRYWAVYDGTTLVCVCLYKKGAEEVVRRLTGRSHCPPGPAQDLGALLPGRSNSILFLLY